jgi:uncharacterized membrane protein YedE/YeeE
MKEETLSRPEPMGPYLLLGIFLGVVFLKTEVISWFRIQEMFRFHSFHMYGIIGGAVAVGALGVFLIKKTDARTITGRPIVFPTPDDSRLGPQHWIGGTIFGLGWGLLGACPGPIYALIGAGVSVMIVGLLAALSGAWVYGLLRPHLPHN